MKTFATIVWLIAFSALVTGLVISFIAIHEKNECKKWATDAGKYTGYYITQWQKDQCDAHEIKIGAPVR